ncbi:MAG: GNAT family N-acetyltransferase [Nitrospirales bacterium]
MKRFGQGLTIELLLDRRDAIPLLANWFVREWPEHYGRWGIKPAVDDLTACCHRDRLPLGLVAIQDGEICGTVALKPESVPAHKHLGPWVAALLVSPDHRGQGIGAGLLEAAVEQARELGVRKLYSATRHNERLFTRAGWTVLDKGLYGGQPLTLLQRDWQL